MNNTEGLKAFSSDEMNKGTEMPENILSLQDKVHKIESAQVDIQLEATATLHHELVTTTKEPVELCVLGSNGMYLLFETLRGEGQELQILTQRCQRGKNDFDFGIDTAHARRTTQIWDFEEFTQSEEDRNTSGHGKLKGNNSMADILPREKIKGFDWIPVTYNGEVMHVQTPEEMIFEKLHSLSRGIDRDPNPKWGIDIKMLKYFIQQTHQFQSDEEVNQYLEGRWQDFETAQISARYNEVVANIQRGMDVTHAYSSVLNIDPTQLNDYLVEQSKLPIEVFTELLQSKDGEQFINNVLKIYKQHGMQQSYTDLYKKAEETFKQIL